MRKKIKIILLVIAGIIVLAITVQIINASKYKMVVNVVEGENIMGINPLPDNLDFGDLSRNNGMTRYVALQNGGSIPTYIVVWKMGEISDLVKLNKNYFTLNPEEEFKLAFEINIPVSAETRQYTGRVWIFRLPKIF